MHSDELMGARAMFPVQIILIFQQMLPAATKLGQGNVFTGVCDSVQGGGGLPQCMLECTPPRADPPWTRHTPPGPHTPPDQTPPSCD